MPRRFPGKRPLIVNIHGGPESQSRPGFLGRSNYLLNEHGIAIFYPNVRGSTGYGKRFVSLDNGPFKREDSVKDIGAFLTGCRRDPALDAGRMAVTGGSYGGYMCYASAIHYAEPVQGRAVQRRHLQLRHIPREYAKLPPRPAPGRIWRRARSHAARQVLEISPLRRIAEIRTPLFVIQGANDPRVPKSEADQIVKARRGNGQAWYLVGENEGHGFAKKENQDYQFWNDVAVLAADPAGAMSDADPPLRAAIIPVTPLQQNCSLLWCTATMRGAFVDPGGDLPG